MAGESGGYSNDRYISRAPKPAFNQNTNSGSGGMPSSIAGGGGPQMPYQPEGPKVQGLVDPLANAGKGLLDPNSEYAQALRNQQWGDIGDKTAAQQRSAALMAARSGMGVGGSPELLETQADIGRQGMETYGDASTQAMLGGIGLGGNMLNQAAGTQLGLQGQGLQAFMGQQQLNAQQQMQQFQAQIEQQRMEQEMKLREMAALYGMLG